MAKPKALKKDFIVDGLEYGTVLLSKGSIAEGMKVMDKVDDQLSRYELQAKTQAAKELVSIMSSEANTPYRGYAYDGIMLNGYKALAFLRLSNVDNCRVELNRAVKRQTDAVEISRQRIEAVKKKMEEAKDKERAEKAARDPKVQGQLEKEYSFLDTLKVYGDYENPFVVYLDGLFFMAHSVGPADMERARKSFERASQFAADNPYVKQDLAAMEAAASGTPIPPTTFVIFESGSAISLKERKILIPTFVGSGAVPAAFPVPSRSDDYVRSLSITAADKVEKTQLLASMDSVIGLEFKKELPGIIRRTIMSTLAKAGIDFGASQVPYLNILSGAFIHGSTRADCRSWYTLPKEIQVCRVPTPEDRKLQIAPADGGAPIMVQVEPGHFNILHVRSVTSKAPLTITQITLK
ncbi:MAG: hypothetical protein HY299_14245 [Verrucomicrobia bacterium]|nr:hypothetical protein [Verrucomicrobiota bacterium]